MFDPHVGQDVKPCPQGTHTAKWPQGTKTIARSLVEHIIHRLVAAVDDWDNGLSGSVLDCLFSDNPLLDASDDSIFMQLWILEVEKKYINAYVKYKMCYRKEVKEQLATSRDMRYLSNSCLWCKILKLTNLLS
jgi:hypothetical protein